ncbi:hypothetical protein CP97_14672 [Aurantiacibacter atlanticus]|uniref:Uncharacterized protein n=1 Tax=Aurantiacibacter atlanticus TaxID=1648404 RepID=A0A168M0L1_9SPHN|nr:hypothetical protein CP97_14672 [Aurantiacibacter atlanticus]
MASPLGCSSFEPVDHSRLGRIFELLAGTPVRDAVVPTLADTGVGATLSQVGLQPHHGPAARIAAFPEIEHKAWITNSFSPEGGRGNVVISQMVFDPFQQGHLQLASTQESLVFLLCS